MCCLPCGSLKGNSIGDAAREMLKQAAHEGLTLSL